MHSRSIPRTVTTTVSELVAYKYVKNGSMNSDRTSGRNGVR